MRKGKSKSLEKTLIARLRTNSAEFAQTVRGTFNNFNSGGVTGQGCCIFLNYPTYLRNFAGSIVQCTTTSGLLANEQKVFDEYKVAKLTVRYVSYVTGQVRVDTSVGFAAPLSPLIFMGVDWDDSALITSKLLAMDLQGCLIANRFSSNGIHTKTIQQRELAGKSSWLNLGAIIPNATTPPDPNNPSKLACLKTWIHGYFLANTTEGEFICEWTVIFKGSYTLA
jgi:hypothetical protein